MNLFKFSGYFKIFIIISLLVTFVSVENLFSMESGNNTIVRKRKHIVERQNLEEVVGQKFEKEEQNLHQIVIGSFEDHQLAQANRFYNLAPDEKFPDKIFFVPKEIWLEIIDYFNFNDPELIYFFAPIMGVNKKQAEKIAFAINNFVIKKSSTLEEIDLKLNKILKTYNKSAQELIKNYLVLLDPGFDSEYKSVRYSVGLLPIRWLLLGPSSMRNNIQNLKKEFNETAVPYYKIDSIPSGFRMKIKDNIAHFDDLRKFSSKVKKRILMYEHFGSKRYKKILDKHRENLGRNTLIIFSTSIICACLIMSYLINNIKYVPLLSESTVLGIIFFIGCSVFVALDESLCDKAVWLEEILDSSQNIIKYLEQKIKAKKLGIENA